MSLTEEEIANRFHYHAPSDDGVRKHKRLTQEFTILAESVEAICPEGREKAVAFTHLETAKMWASAAVARNPETC